MTIDNYFPYADTNVTLSSWLYWLEMKNAGVEKAPCWEDTGKDILDFVRCSIDDKTGKSEIQFIPRSICNAIYLPVGCGKDMRHAVAFQDHTVLAKFNDFLKTKVAFKGSAFRSQPDVIGYVQERYDTVHGKYLDLYVSENDIERLRGIITSNKGVVGHRMVKVSIPEWRVRYI